MVNRIYAGEVPSYILAVIKERALIRPLRILEHIGIFNMLPTCTLHKFKYSLAHPFLKLMYNAID